VSSPPPAPNPATTEPPKPGLRPGQGWAISGIAAGAMAVWVLPLVLGGMGMGFGVLAMVRGERRGRWVIVIAAIGLLLGLLVEALPKKFTGN
jgi:hypothetical protein